MPKAMNELEEKDEIIRLRLPSSMKKSLQLLAKRKGINMSQFLRNYITSIIEQDENRDILHAKDNAYLDTPSDADNPYGSTVTIRIPTEMKYLYRTCCTSNSAKASELLRNLIRDYTELKTSLYSAELRPLSGYIHYLLMFLRAAEYNKGNALKNYRMVRAHDKLAPDTPIFEKVDDNTYKVNDVLAQCYYIIEFEDLFNVMVNTSPFE